MIDGEEVRHYGTEVVAHERHAFDPAVVEHCHEVFAAADGRAVARQRTGGITEPAEVRDQQGVPVCE
jgi:hypothetical protein